MVTIEAMATGCVPLAYDVISGQPRNHRKWQERFAAAAGQLRGFGEGHQIPLSKPRGMAAAFRRRNGTSADAIQCGGYGFAVVRVFEAGADARTDPSIGTENRAANSN